MFDNVCASHAGIRDVHRLGLVECGHSHLANLLGTCHRPMVVLLRVEPAAYLRVSCCKSGDGAGEFKIGILFASKAIMQIITG